MKKPIKYTKQHSKIKIPLLITLSIGLGGCGNDSVNSVKNSYTDNQETTTFEQLLDNRTICDETEWLNSTDNLNRDIVEYRCIFSGTQDVEKGKIAAAEKKRLRTLEVKEEAITEVKGYIEELENEIFSIIENSNTIESERIQDYIDTYQKPLDQSDYLDSLIKLNQKATQLTENYSDSALINFAEDENLFKIYEHSSRTGGHTGRISTTSIDALSTIKAQARYMHRIQTEHEREAYIDANIAPYIEEAKYYSKLISEFIRNEIPAEREKIALAISSYNTNLESEKARITQALKDSIASNESDIEAYREKIKNFENEIEKLKEPAQVKTFETVYEKIQWVVNKDGQASLLSQEIFAEMPSNADPIKLMDYSNTKIFTIISIANNSQNNYNYASYIELIRASGLVDFLEYGGHL